MESQPDEACTNASIAASDVAVGGSVNGRNKASAPRVVVAAPAGETPRNEDPNNITVQHKNNHFRKRALSTATSGTAGSNGNGFDNGESLGALSTSGISLLANSLNPMPSNGIGSGGEGSIVSFGLNFNFDSTSSPSNSDSGEGEKGEGKEGSDGENNKAEEYKPKASAEEVNGAGQSPKKTSNGSGSERSNKDKVKQDGDGSPPSANNNKENSESASDSGQDQDYNSGGSAASGSGNDGSSGGKSTISSLTTSSNQEWMASQNKEAKQAGVGEGASSKKIGEDGNRPKAIPKEGAAANGKKRKKISQGNVAGNDEDSTGGYNTDEEQWGGKINNKADGAVGNPIVHKQHHVVTTNTGNSDPSSLTDSNMVHQSKGGPPLKQARFSIDQTPHPRAVPSAETSAQMGLSSLSSDTPTPNAAFANGRIPLPSLTSAAQISASNPSAQAPTIAAAPKPRAKRGASGKHHSATLDPKKREERNAREKERSCRIAKQIDELRSLLSRGGVIVAKGTKSSVLAEAANYINLLQQQQVQWEMDRQAMLQQMQEVGANPSSVHSQSQLPQSMQHMDPNGMIMGQQQMAPAVPPSNPNAFNAIEPNDYQFVFNNSSVGMAIASMGGAYVDCNDNFCKLSGYSKQEVCSMTIFNMTSRNDLQHAFDLISQMITPNPDCPNQQDESKSIILQGAMRSRNDLGLSISLIKGSQGIGRCFCVTLVRIISMNKSRPDVISVEMELPVIPNKNDDVGLGTSPAYTAG